MDLCHSTSEYRIETNRGLLLTNEGYPFLAERDVNCEQNFTFPPNASIHVYVLTVIMPAKDQCINMGNGSNST
jgi:hypothetical protein